MIGSVIVVRGVGLVWRFGLQGGYGWPESGWVLLGRGTGAFQLKRACPVRRAQGSVAVTLQDTSCVRVFEMLRGLVAQW